MKPKVVSSKRTKFTKFYLGWLWKKEKRLRLLKSEMKVGMLLLTRPNKNDRESTMNNRTPTN